MSEKLPSTRPYLIRALHEWCSDNGFTPYISVLVDERTRVPREFVREGKIILNVSYDATNRLQIGNEGIGFQGRFGGVARDIFVPIGSVVAVYAKENHDVAMVFEYEKSESDLPSGSKPPGGNDEPSPPPGGRPKLQRIK